MTAIQVCTCTCTCRIGVSVACTFPLQLHIVHVYSCIYIVHVHVLEVLVDEWTNVGCPAFMLVSPSMLSSVPYNTVRSDLVVVLLSHITHSSSLIIIYIKPSVPY